MRFLICLVFFVAWGQSVAEEPFVIRKVRWGMSPNEVVKSEKSDKWEYKSSELDEKKGVYRIVYHGHMLDVKSALVYYFTSSDSTGELISAMYTFIPDGQADGKRVFRSLLEILNKKYGTPARIDQSFGIELAKCEWENSKTAITLSAGAFVIPSVTYDSREHPGDL